MEKQNQILNINQALISIMREVPVIEKGEKNTQQNFMFRGIDRIMNDLHDSFARHGVVILLTGCKKEVKIRTAKSGGDLIHTDILQSYRFIAEDGSYVDVTDVPGEAMDSGDKSTFKALSGALKYCLLAMFLIPTAEKKDPDSDTYEIKQPAAKPALPELKPELKAGTDQYNNVVEWLATKKGSTIEKVKEKYRLSQQVQLMIEADVMARIEPSTDIS